MKPVSLFFLLPTSRIADAVHITQLISMFHAEKPANYKCDLSSFLIEFSRNDVKTTLELKLN